MSEPPTSALSVDMVDPGLRERVAVMQHQLVGLEQDRKVMADRVVGLTDALSDVKADVSSLREKTDSLVSKVNESNNGMQAIRVEMRQSFADLQTSVSAVKAEMREDSAKVVYSAVDTKINPRIDDVSRRVKAIEDGVKDTHQKTWDMAKIVLTEVVKLVLSGGVLYAIAKAAGAFSSGG